MLDINSLLNYEIVSWVLVDSFALGLGIEIIYLIGLQLFDFNNLLIREKNVSCSTSEIKLQLIASQYGKEYQKERIKKQEFTF